jgi:drug/metabolite transporter (DMT)-like permease
MDPVRRAYLEIHLAVLLFGLTAILGDLISLSALSLVWWRVLLTSISLLFLVRLRKLFRELPSRVIAQFAGIGVIVALHWLAFYGAIKYSNASITLVMMATASFFTALLEPLLLRQRLKFYELGLGLLMVPGMVLIVNHTELSMQTGIWVGLLSAFLAALFATLNKKLIGRANPIQITLVEISSAWLFLSLALPFYLLRSPDARLMPEASDWIYLLVLALLCTTLAYVLAVRSLQHLSAFASSFIVNLEPVYGILLAVVILKEHEQLSGGFYFGVAVILLAVLSYPMVRKWASRWGV